MHSTLAGQAASVTCLGYLSYTHQASGLPFSRGRVSSTSWVSLSLFPSGSEVDEGDYYTLRFLNGGLSGLASGVSVNQRLI